MPFLIGAGGVRTARETETHAVAEQDNTGRANGSLMRTLPGHTVRCVRVEARDSGTELQRDVTHWRA